MTYSPLITIYLIKYSIKYKDNVEADQKHEQTTGPTFVHSILSEDVWRILNILIVNYM